MNDLLLRAIDHLSSSDSEARMTAATEIHHLGRGQAHHAVYPWWADEELSSLLGNGSPFVTVGLAVNPERFEKIREAAGSPRLAEVPPDQDALEFELHLPGGLSMDVLTSKDPEGSGAIAKFLHKFGEGIQQVEFRCDNVARATEILQDKFSIVPVYQAARPGADGSRVNFFLLSAPGAAKILIELYEPAQRLD
jgi:methylmalonyl-CoA/ethylmalonyl-CoA epimerase